MSNRTLYFGHATSKVGKGYRIKIPDPFGTMLSQNGRQLRIMIGKSLTENCLICCDMGVRDLDSQQCRKLIDADRHEEDQPSTDTDRSVFGSFFTVDLSLNHQFRIPEALVQSYFNCDHVIFISTGNAIEIWDPAELKKSRGINKRVKQIISYTDASVH